MIAKPNTLALPAPIASMQPLPDIPQGAAFFVLVRANGKASKCFEKLSYSRAEAAQATGLTLNTIREAVSTGELKAKRKKRQWIILSADLQEWLER
jgi:excisionase family DNA binding protein